ncbi:MAG: hypothetical protein O2822_05480 [Chloroflexi bacterium]|nr:hypothetical protein [Chloroflexota bacterium]
MYASRPAAVRRLLAVSALAVLALATAAPTAALAHEGRDVGGYNFVIGFLVEPALEGQMNGLDLQIKKAGQSIAGAEKTLKFDVTHVQSNATRTLPIRAVHGAPGHYTADFLPTLNGQYRFKIYGDIQGTSIDATFESGPGSFSNVEPIRELMFPVAAAQPRELEGAIRSAGMGLGAAGLVVGAMGFMAARRARE